MHDLKNNARLKLFHVDGAGQRPDGTGSGFAWVRIGTDKQRVRQVDRLTNNQAEYHGLLAVVKYLAEGSSARVWTDSQLICKQFNREWAVNDDKLAELLSRIRSLIEDKRLQIEVKWIPRGQNEAGKLLERTKL